MAAKGSTEAALRGYPSFVRGVLRDWKVNGAAIAIVRDGQIVFCEGFGLRDAARKLPVTDHTLFPQASVTKAFTTMALGILADEGLIDWDTPVRTYLPDFQLWDPFASERITPRDLVTHRSGLPRHDLVWYHADITREDMVRRLRYLQPTKDFRTFWQYQNMMYVTAGYLAGKVAGCTWEDVVRTRIFEPLGMVSSAFSVQIAQQSPDFSQPYMKKKGRTEQIPFYEENNVMGPAGAIVSNLADMSQWVLLQLKKGTVADGRLVSEGQINQMHAPQVVHPTPGRFPEMPQSSYGLGWLIEPYRGHRMLHHSGGINGFSTLVSFMPDEGVGVIALTNMNGSPAPYILSWNVFDRMLDLEHIPWTARFKEDFKQYERAEERGKQKRVSDRIHRTRPSHPLEAYTGSFEHPAYGRIAIRLDANKLIGLYHDMELVLKHFHYDVFETTIEEFEYPLKLQFHTDTRGNIARVSGPFEPTVDDIVFTRVPDAAMTDREFLERLAGTYELLGFQVPVTFKGDALQIAVPGQPEYELIPIKGSEFALAGISDFSVEFQVGSSGTVTGALLNQMGSVFELKRREATVP